MMIRFGISDRNATMRAPADSSANPNSTKTANSRMSRNGSVLGLLVVEMRRRLSQDQHLFELAEIDRRRDLHAQEKSRTVAAHALDRSDQQAARENSVETRGHDRIPGANVLRAVGVLHDHAIVDQPGDDSARAGALVEAVERGVVIVDHQHTRRVRTDGDDLADDALVSEHGHAGTETIAGTRGENQGALDAVGVFV